MARQNCVLGQSAFVSHPFTTVGAGGAVSFTQVPGASHVGSEHWQVSPEAHLL